MQSVAPESERANPPAVHGRARSAVFDSQTRFELLSKLGQGAHGEVFAAIDRARGTRVAIKALRDTTPQSILRFKREFRSLATLHHVNLVELGELFEDDGRWFFSMELIEGQDFLRHVRAGTGERPRSHEQIDRLMNALHQLGCGLRALHRAGKIHRDIKPSNIRVQPDGRVVLLDFGLVAPAAHGSRSDVERVVGTVGYMAPEQASARPLSAAADCYAVGVLLYEALVDEQPFSGTVLEVLLAKQSQPVVIPAAIAARWPASLVQLCHDLCRIDPAERASVDALIARTQSVARQAPKLLESSLPASDNTACFGRDTELELLERAFDIASAGALSKVRVCGASGVGKTALLRAFRERLSRRDTNMFVLSGSCNEQERVTHKAFDAAIDELGRKLERLSREQCAALVPKHVSALVSLFPVLGRLALCTDTPARALPPDPVVLQQRAYAALRDLLHRMTERAPVVLMLDDLQWADSESLELLDALTRAPDPPPLLLLAAMWPAHDCSSELREQLDSAFSDANTLQLSIGVLPSAAAVELARKLLMAAADGSQTQSPERIAEAAGRHPLFIEVLARAGLPVAGGNAQLEQVLWNEVRALTRRAQHLLQLLAVAGTEIEESTLADAAGVSPEHLAEALTELRRRRLLRVRAFTVCVSHTKIRTAILSHVDAMSLRQHHFALAAAFTRAAHGDREAVALHWLAAGQPRAAADCFAQAAQLAQASRAFDHAAQLYRSALDALADSNAELRAEWLQAWAMCLAHAGRSADAAEAFVAAADSGRTERKCELQRRAAEQYLRAGMVNEGLAIARSLLADIGEKLAHNNSVALAMLGWRRTWLELRGTQLHERAPSDGSDRERYACDLLWSLGVPLTSLDFVRGQDLHYRCLVRALRLGDAARTARSLSLHALYMRLDDADDELRIRGVLATAETLAQRSNEPYLLAFNQMCHSAFLVLNGEPIRALSMADAAASLFEEGCSNAAWELGLSRINALSALSFLGRFRELGTRFAAAAEEAKAHGNLHAFTTLVAMNRCSIDLAADRIDGCRSQLQRLMESCPAEWHLQHAYALGANVLLDLYVGGDAAHLRLAAGWKNLRHQLILTSERYRIFFVFARGLAALAAALTSERDRSVRIRLVRSCAARLVRERLADAHGAAHLLRGQLAVLEGELANAVDEYRKAAELWGRAGMFGTHIVNLRIGEIIGGDEGAVMVASCMRWAHEEGIRRPEQFFRVWSPVVAKPD
jgi:serine/threonine protein kinase